MPNRLNEFEMDFAERSLADKKMDVALFEGVRKLHRAMSETLSRERFPLGERIYLQARHYVTTEYWHLEAIVSNDVERRLQRMELDERAWDELNGLHHLAGAIDPLKEPSRFAHKLVEEELPPPPKEYKKKSA